MRIFLNGIGAFGVDVFNKLREQGEEIVAVAAPLSSLSGRPDRLRSAAEDAGIPAFEPGRLGDPEVEASLRATAPELGVMAFVQDFIGRQALELPVHGSIQYHPSLLPRHRGRSSINWAIIQGDSKTGVSIFWPDEGMDTGPILMQREVEIGPHETVGSLYYNKLYQLGIDMLAESVDLVRAGKAPKIAQDESLATYERPCQDRAARIDWRLPLRDVYNLVRGCDPSPGAWSPWRDGKLRILEARPLADVDLAPGVVGAIDADGIVIGAGGGAIRAARLAVDSASSAAASDVASQHGIEPGVRFLNPRAAEKA